MKDLKEIFPNEWEQAIQKVIARYKASKEKKEAGEWFIKNDINPIFIGENIFHELKEILEKENPKNAILETLEFCYNSDETLDDEIFIVCKENDKYFIARQNIFCNFLYSDFMEIIKEVK